MPGLKARLLALMGFKDTAGHWAEKDIERARQEGLVGGRGDGLFDPDAPVTRAENAVVDVRLLDKVREEVAAAVAAERNWLPRLVERVRPAVVTVISGGQVGAGSLLPGGYVLTNFHVVRRADGQPDPAPVVRFDESVGRPPREVRLIAAAPQAGLDLALYSTELEGLPWLEFCSCADVRQGEDLVVIGSPLGVPGLVSRGIVSGVGHTEDLGLGQRVPVLFTDADINPGNSGGPALTRHGHLVAVMTAKRLVPLRTDLAVPAEGLGIGITQEAVSEWLDAQAPMAAVLIFGAEHDHRPFA